MKKTAGHGGAFRPWLLLALSSAVGVWAVLHVATDLHFRKAVPAGVPIGPMIWHGGEIGSLSGCGMAVFRLSPGDSARIARDGVRSLGPAMHGRGYGPREPDRAYPVPQGARIDRRHVGHLYGPWRPTPIPPSWTEGTWLGLGCSGSLRTRAFTRAAESEGGFYASSRRGWILVSPGLNRVLYSYGD